MKSNSELKSVLKAFGFGDNEALVYLAGLELGPASVLEISRRASLPRTTIYPILEDLTRRGFFEHGSKKGKTLYTAESPKILISHLKAREKMLVENLPKLEALCGTVHASAGVIFFEGTDGFKQLWQRVFKSGVKEYRIITSGVGLLEFVREPYLVEKIIAERVRRGIKSKQLIQDTKAAERIVEKDKKELRESRLLPVDIKIPATMIIFGEEVAFITTRLENTMIIVASGEVAITCQSVFDLLWLSSKPVTIQ